MKIGTLTENRTQEFCLEGRHFTIKLLARLVPSVRLELTTAVPQTAALPHKLTKGLVFYKKI